MAQIMLVTLAERYHWTPQTLDALTMDEIEWWYEAACAVSRAARKGR